MVSLTLTMSIKAENGKPAEHADYVAALVKELAERGIHLNAQNQVSKIRPETEKGPNEIAYLESRGLKRMKVPATWNGTREAYAAHMLESKEPESEEPESEVETFWR